MKGYMHAQVVSLIILFQIKLLDLNGLKQYYNIGMLFGVCIGVLLVMGYNSFGGIINFFSNIVLGLVGANVALRGIIIEERLLKNVEKFQHFP